MDGSVIGKILKHYSGFNGCTVEPISITVTCNRIFKIFRFIYLIKVILMHVINSSERFIRENEGHFNWSSFIDCELIYFI